MDRKNQTLDALVKLVVRLSRGQANTLAQLVLTVVHLTRFPLAE